MGYVITIHNQKGGTGKSTTATCLATLLGLIQRQVVLIDSDPQGNATDAMGYKRRRISGGKGYAEFLQAKRTGRTIVQRKVQRAGQTARIGVLSACKEKLIALEAHLQHPMVSLDTNEVADKICALAEENDYVIIDTAPGVNHLSVAALKAADVVISPVLPTGWSIEAVQEVKDTIAMVREEEVPVWPVMVMASNTKATEKSYKLLTDAYGDDVFSSMVRRSGSVEGYETKGKTLLQVRSTSSPSQDYVAFTQEFLSRMEEA
jgi:chromosome partitioning protein